MRLNKLLETIGFSRFSQSEAIKGFEVKGISSNSKEIKREFVFIAVPGARLDGKKFIPEAIGNGARVVVVQGPRCKIQDTKKILTITVKDARAAAAKLAAEFFGNPSLRTMVAGVTGTNGKTTVTYLLESILRENGSTPAVVGTINYRYKGKVFVSKNTTPGPIELQAMLADMSGAGVDYVAMEVSSHALDQKRTEAINFHSAIFTNLTQDHLDYHKTPERYFQAKSRLFRNLKSSSYAVINNDDLSSGRLKRATSAKIITYAIEAKALVTARDIKYGLKGSEFLLEHERPDKDSMRRQCSRIRTSLIGRHNVYNVLAACAWAIGAQISLPVITKALEGFTGVPGRLQRINNPGNLSVFVDYAHTPDALENIITALKSLAKKRVMVVFGCGGERDKGKRPKMGRSVTELADYAIITNDNPRSEDPFKIIEDIKKGIRKDNYAVIPERMYAIKKILGMAKPSDIVLIAGKGHENYQVLKDRIIDFDDVEAVKQCLKSVN